MARTFSVPQYQFGTQARLLAYAGFSSDEQRSWLNLGLLREPVPDLPFDRYLSPNGARYAELDALWDFGSRADAVNLAILRSAYAKTIGKVISESSKFVFASEAQLAVLARQYTGRVGATARDPAAFSMADEAADEVAAVGMVASMASPRASADAVRRVTSWRKVTRSCPVAASCRACSEPWRMGVSSREASDRLREMTTTGLSAALDEQSFELRSGSWRRCYPEGTAYVFMDLLIWDLGDVVIVLSPVHRAELSEVLWTASQWPLYGEGRRAASCGPDALGAAKDAIRYVGAALTARIEAGFRTDTLAKQMKTCYAASMAEFNRKNEPDQDFVSYQCSHILAEAVRLKGPEGLWYDVTKTWPERVQMDMGTAWNLLTASDASAQLQDEAFRRKMNAPRSYDKLAFQRFRRYRCAVITAHLIASDPEAVGEWRCVDDLEVDSERCEALEWVKACRRGELAYPRSYAECGVKLTRLLPWIHHLENWEFTAQDCTHVSADASRYSSAEATAANKDDETNELLYVLAHGRLLSHRYHPEDVRAALEAGDCFWDALALIASKRENTKLGVPLDGDDVSSTRETLSACDIVRELLTEFDINAAAVCRKLHGVAAGCGRAELERKSDSLLSSAGGSDMLIALDAVGWSPNMVREIEMDTADDFASRGMVADLFRPSKVFKEVNCITSRSGFFRSGVVIDGSVQGWFVQVDSALNSLATQWCVFEGKQEGFFPDVTRVEKECQIDDMLGAFINTGKGVREVTEFLIAKLSLLGIKADLVKTLAAVTKGHFLNRLLVLMKKGRAEVVTACKIFCKANREYERKYSGLSSRIRSVFNSYLGAADRGACPVLCYRTACCRALSLVAAARGTSAKFNAAETCFVAFQDPAIGGWGFPVFGQWVTRDCDKALDAGVSGSLRLARTVKESSPHVAATITALCAHVAKLRIKVPSYVAYADDPATVRSAHAVDPEESVANLMRAARDRATTDPSMRRLCELSESAQYEKMFEMVVKASNWPAPVLAHWSSGMPHAVIRSLVVKAERNEVLLRKTGFRERKKVGERVRADNRRFANAYKAAYRGANSVGPEIPTAFQVCSVLRARQQELMGSDLTFATLPSLTDQLVRVEENGMAKLYVPACSAEGALDGHSKSRLTRTAVSAGLSRAVDDASLRRDPIAKAYGVIVTTASIVRSLGGDPKPLTAAFGQAWTGDPELVVADIRDIGTTNPMRLCGRTCRRSHTVMMLPNAIGSINVDASRLTARADLQRMLIDPLAAVYFLKHIAGLGLIVHNSVFSGAVFEFSLRGYDAFCIDDDSLRAPSEVDVSQVDCVLAGKDRGAAVAKMGFMSGMIAAAEAEAAAGTASVVVPGSVLADAMAIPPGRVMGALVAGEVALVGVPRQDAASERDVKVLGMSMRPSAMVKRSVTHLTTQQRSALSMVIGICSRESAREEGGGSAVSASSLSEIDQVCSQRKEELVAMGLWEACVAARKQQTVGSVRKLSDKLGVHEHDGLVDRSEMWKAYADKHRARSEDVSAQTGARLRSRFVATVMDTWAAIDSQHGRGWADQAWQTTLNEIRFSVLSSYKRAGLTHENYADPCGMPGHSEGAEAAAQALSAAVVSALRTHPKNIQDVLDAAVSVARSAHGWYESDILAPLAAAARSSASTGMAATSLDFAVALPGGATEECAPASLGRTAERPAELGAYLAQMGMCEESLDPDDVEEYYEEAANWARSRANNVDVV